MALSNFITHLIRISGRPVVTAGVYSRVTLAASTHRSHLSSIPLLLRHRFLAPLFFRSRSSSRQWDRIDAVSNVSRRVHCWALQFLFFPPSVSARKRLHTNDCFRNRHDEIYFARDDTPSLGFEILSIEHRPTIFSRYYHQVIQGYGEHGFFFSLSRTVPLSTVPNIYSYEFFLSFSLFTPFLSLG